MKSNYIDKRVKNELCNSCHMMEVSDDLKQKIDCEIEEQIKREKYKMRKINKKKMAILAFAACLFVSVNCFAAGKIQSLVVGTNKNDIVKDYSKLDKEENKLGYNVKAVKNFANDYSFKKMSVDKVKGLDESGNKVAEYKEINITYQKEGKEIELGISKKIQTEETQLPTEIRQINGINVEYSLDTYKFVPADYQLTDEDNLNITKEHYYISNGSDEIKIQQVSSLKWEDEGLTYILQQFDTEMTIEQLTDMVSEIIESK